MPKLPEKIYLKRSDVLTVVGGRRQLERLEREGVLRRIYLTGYVYAHYLRAEVKRVLDDLAGAAS
jgi:hypothetical protein